MYNYFLPWGVSQAEITNFYQVEKAKNKPSLRDRWSRSNVKALTKMKVETSPQVGVPNKKTREANLSCESPVCTIDRERRQIKIFLFRSNIWKCFLKNRKWHFIDDKTALSAGMFTTSTKQWAKSKKGKQKAIEEAKERFGRWKWY